MLGGDLPAVAAAALTGGEPRSPSSRCRSAARSARCSPRPRPAWTTPSTSSAATAVFEAKLDGARVQIHRAGDDVSIYTRSLDDVTARLPEVVEATLALPVTDAHRRRRGHRAAPRRAPAPVPGDRVAVRRGGGGEGPSVDRGRRAAQPLSVFFFDLLHLDGADLLDLPTAERLAALDAIVPAAPARRPADHLRRRRGRSGFLAATLAAGHEGVMAKSPTAPYEAGRRGAGWLKVKPVHTLDLVVLGRRVGLGPAHRQAVQHPPRRPRPRHRRLRHARQDVQGHDRRDAGLADRAVHRAGRRARPTATWCTVRPEQVVEIAFDGVQTSTRYPGGMALRFARVLRYRDDKSPAEADTIDTVRALYERG